MHNKNLRYSENLLPQSNLQWLVSNIANKVSNRGKKQKGQEIFICNQIFYCILCGL